MRAVGAPGKLLTVADLFFSHKFEYHLRLRAFKMKTARNFSRLRFLMHARLNPQPARAMTNKKRLKKDHNRYGSNNKMKI